MQCVPAALLEMSRAITRATFSAVVVKAVYTFAYDRLATAAQTRAQASKLAKAKATGAVVVCSPTSLKVRGPLPPLSRPPSRLSSPLGGPSL